MHSVASLPQYLALAIFGGGGGGGGDSTVLDKGLETNSRNKAK